LLVEDTEHGLMLMRNALRAKGACNYPRLRGA
jgi:hypothetical protein